MEASMCAEKIYTSNPPFCFICSFLFVQLLSDDRDLRRTASEDVRGDLFRSSEDEAHGVISESGLVSSDVYFVSFSVVWTAGTSHITISPLCNAFMRVGVRGVPYSCKMRVRKK